MKNKKARLNPVHLQNQRFNATENYCLQEYARTKDGPRKTPLIALRFP
jgi:hypothetical protein